MHIHLDPVGGIAGDMFVAAVLDLRPKLAPIVMEAVRAAGLGRGFSVVHKAFTDGILTGSRFEVGIEGPDAGGGVGEEHTHSDQFNGVGRDRGSHGHSHRLGVEGHASHGHHAPGGAAGHHHHHGGPHHHVHWSEIQHNLAKSALPGEVRDRAIEIFALLADAEARVHGRHVDDVTFHEVGAWDSIADIVAAATLIEALPGCEWSIGPVPIGSGFVSTDHGRLPVPAPATALLLNGFSCFDDGLTGERVTPTGAAIVRHLNPKSGLGPMPRTLVASAHGFGTRRYPGLSNVLRLLEFEAVRPRGCATDQVAVISFEVDDQTSEDLAQGLENLRAHTDVIDVAQHPVMGKRSRLAMGVQVLARPEAADSVFNACFHETTTLGLRVAVVDRIVLHRQEKVAEGNVRVKVVQRPLNITAKADISDVCNSDGHFERQSRRDKAVSEVLFNGK